MIIMKNSKKKIISIGNYKVLDVLQSNDEKDIFHVQDLKNHSKEYTLRILKSNQNPKQIDTEIEILNRLNPYSETLNFQKLEIFSDKLLFIFDYSKGKDLLSLYNENKNFFDNQILKIFVKDLVRILEIYKENNILHGNIKPENIIFNGEQFYLIGLSKARFTDVKDQKEDIISLVSVLYFLLIGEHYYEELMLSGNIDKGLSNIIGECLKDKKEIDLNKLRNYIDKI